MNGTSVAGIFEHHGESFFRGKEIVMDYWLSTSGVTRKLETFDDYVDDADNSTHDVSADKLTKPVSTKRKPKNAKHSSYSSRSCSTAAKTRDIETAVNGMQTSITTSWNKAFLAYGVPQNNVKRVLLLLKAAYNVGGHIVSAEAIRSSIPGCKMSHPG